jgi:GNAT superfamily N-acetyltransferase
MPDWTIREARPGDGPGLAELHEAVARDYMLLDPDRFKLPDPVGMAEWMDEELEGMGETWICFVATENDRIIGEVEARLQQPMEAARYQVIASLGTPRGYVNSLGVLASHRRRGIGRALMQQTEQWLIKRGATVIELDTLASSPDSVPFYEAIGYRGRSIIFERRV